MHRPLHESAAAWRAAGRAVALAAALCAAAGVPAQQAPRPPVQPGDRWQFVVFHGERPSAPNRTWLVERVGATQIEATENGEPLRLSTDLNLIESPARRESNLQALRFPLRVGDRWSYETDTVFKDNGSTARSSVAVQVVAFERVEVVAGGFDAFRLEAAGSFRGLSRGGPGVLEGRFTTTYWYAPSVRAVVKSTLTSPYRGTSHVELVSVRLQP